MTTTIESLDRTDGGYGGVVWSPGFAIQCNN
jgi:hypothetical protein